jgi:hypothetical protein
MRRILVIISIVLLVAGLGSASVFYANNADVLTYIQVHSEVPFAGYAKGDSMQDVRSLIRVDRAEPGLFNAVLANQDAIEFADIAIAQMFARMLAYEEEAGIVQACISKQLPCLSYRLELDGVRDEPLEMRDRIYTVWIGDAGEEPLIV